MSWSPVTSTIRWSGETPAILALKISTIWIISERVSLLALILMRASSRETTLSLDTSDDADHVDELVQVLVDLLDGAFVALDDKGHP